MNSTTYMIIEMVGCDAERALRIQDYMESEMDLDFSEASMRTIKKCIMMAAEAVQ